MVILNAYVCQESILTDPATLPSLPIRSGTVVGLSGVAGRIQSAPNGALPLHSYLAPVHKRCSSDFDHDSCILTRIRLCFLWGCPPSRALLSKETTLRLNQELNY